MQRALVRFIRDGSDSSEDDVIRIYDTDCNDLFRVVFQASEMKRGNEFFAPRRYVMQYIAEVFRTLTHDSDPFESVQVDTAIHPSVLYHVIDMDEDSIRRLMEDSVDSALCRTIVKTDTE